MPSEYPKKVYASVALLDGKIINYKVNSVGRYWDSRHAISWKGQISIDDVERVVTEYIGFEVNTNEDNDFVFKTLAPVWYGQWEVHPQYRGANPYLTNPA